MRRSLSSGRALIGFAIVVVLRADLLQGPFERCCGAVGHGRRPRAAGELLSVGIEEGERGVLQSAPASKDVREDLGLGRVFVGLRSNADESAGGGNDGIVGQDTPIRVLIARSPDAGDALALWRCRHEEDRPLRPPGLLEGSGPGAEPGDASLGRRDVGLQRSLGPCGVGSPGGGASGRPRRPPEARRVVLRSSFVGRGVLGHELHRQGDHESPAVKIEQAKALRPLSWKTAQGPLWLTPRR